MKTSVKIVLTLLLMCLIFIPIVAAVTWDDVFKAYQKFNKKGEIYNEK